MPEASLQEQDQSTRMRAIIRRAVDRLPNKVRFRAMNACDGIERAIQLIESDREIASFRAITAQEEAASAVFNSLKMQNYPGSEHLNLYWHPHKAAFWFIVDALHHSLGRGLNAMKFNLEVNASKPEVAISFPINQFGVEDADNRGLHIFLSEPFHMLQSKGGTPDTFEAEINEILSARGAKKLDRYIKSLANDRNKILYANDQGLPNSQATFASIQLRRDRIYLALVLCIGILQTPVVQHFIDQGLQALLQAVGKGTGDVGPSLENSADLHSA